MRSDSDRLNDILGAISKIKERVATDFDNFRGDEMLQVWVIHHLQVIGEAARGVSQFSRGRYPEVPWTQIVALRNILVHEYFGLNMQQLWMVTQRELPALEQQILAIRHQASSDSRHDLS